MRTVGRAFGGVVVAAVLAGTSSLVLSTPAQAQTVVTGTVRACVRVKGTTSQKGAVRILSWPGARFVGAGPKACTTNEVNVYWDFYGGGNGPIGPDGDTGVAGPKGDTGPGYTATASGLLAVGTGLRTFSTQTRLA